MEEKKNSLEERFANIEEILQQMENPEVSLEDSFGLYKKGMEELEQANQMLDGIEKEMLVVKGAEHSNSIKVNPQLYWATIEKFLEKYSVQRSER